MATLTEQEVYELAVYLIEITDAVIGGANGIANLQAKQLANRTAWLKANKQDKDATLTALAAVVTAADKMIYATGADTFSTTTLTAFARTLLDDVDATAMRATLGAQPAGSYQASDATLTALAALVTAADKMIYSTGSDTFAMTTLTAFARTLLDDPDAEAMRATLGVLNPNQKQLASAWVKFNGITTPPTIISSINISSVARLSTGVFRLYFSTPMSNTNMVAAGMIRDLDTSANNHNVTGHDSVWTTEYIDVRTEYGTGTVINFSDIGVVVFGGIN